MIRRESQFGLLFRRWWLANRRRLPAAWFELKDAGAARSLPFRAVEPHQADFAAAAASEGGTLARVMAGTVGAGDYVGGQLPTYYAIRYPGFFCLVLAEDFAAERARAGNRGGLKDARARAIAWKVVELPRSYPHPRRGLATQGSIK